MPKLILSNLVHQSFSRFVSFMAFVRSILFVPCPQMALLYQSLLIINIDHSCNINLLVEFSEINLRQCHWHPKTYTDGH